MKEYKILAVDDDHNVLDAMETLFDDYSVKTTLQPQKAMEMIYNEHFHFIFLDIYMAPLSGLDLCREARKSRFNKDSFIYAYTSENRQNVLEKFYEVDFDDVIEKFVDYSIIKKKMQADSKREMRSKILSLYNQKITSILTELPEEKEYTLNNMPLNLTKCEYKVVKILTENRHRELTSGDICNIFTGDYNHYESSTIREHIMNIKKKFLKVESSTQYIQKLSKGYILKNC
jgi:DNA-binding response OmpR family regulator